MPFLKILLASCLLRKQKGTNIYSAAHLDQALRWVLQLCHLQGLKFPSQQMSFWPWLTCPVKSRENLRR